MKIKLIALDMDGTTLLDDFKSISRRNQEAIEAAIEKGIAVVPATGRNRALIPEAITAIQGIDYLVSSNGAIVNDLKSGEMISANYIGAGMIEKLIAVFAKKRTFYGINYQGENYIEKGSFDRLEDRDQFDSGHIDLVKSESIHVDSLSDFALAHKSSIEKIEILFLTDHQRRLYWQKFSNYKGLSLTAPIPDFIEVTHQKSNKAEGLRALCQHLKINPQQVMAIGDSDNDQEMFKFVGLPIAVENATAELKILAQAQTHHYLEDGVAHAIEKFAL